MATVRLDQKRRWFAARPHRSRMHSHATLAQVQPTSNSHGQQQRAHIKALEDNGVSVHRLPADENHPDCMFVEDQAVVVDGHMLLPTPGHPSRVAEQPPIAEFLMAALLEGVQTCTMGGSTNGRRGHHST